MTRTKQIACTRLKPGDVLITSHGPRTITHAAEVRQYGRRVWRWSWNPGKPGDIARIDCGYSGHQLPDAKRHMVEVQQ